MSISEIHQQFLQSNGICTDTRKLQNNQLFFALKGENFNGNLFAEKAIENGATHAIVDEKKYAQNTKCIFVEDVLGTLQKLATYHRKYLNLCIIAITGSNGKTTTKELIREVLSKKYSLGATQGNLNNHIGVPLTLLSFTKETEIGIVEMGANHQKEISSLCKIAQPDYGYITNFGKAHLEGFGGFEGVVKGKSELYDYLRTKEAQIFINKDDDWQVKQSKNANLISFEEGKDSDFQITFLEAKPYVKVLFNEHTVNSQLIGNYNAKNIAAAICIGLYFKVPEIEIKKAVEQYKPENNRSQFILKNSRQILLDAYNANPTSMQLALESFNQLEANSKTLILGDMLEVGKDTLKEHQQIIAKIEALNFENVILVGNNFCATEVPSKFLQFKGFKTLADYLQKNNLQSDAVLIKGSRAIALERSLDYL